MTHEFRGMKANQKIPYPRSITCDICNKDLGVSDGWIQADVYCKDCYNKIIKSW